MEYISSDTNIWIDFVTIDSLELPFKLPCTYVISDLTMEDEVLQPQNLSDDLLELGLKIVEITTEEFQLVEQLVSKYRHNTVYDCIALAIAKTRMYTLLTGDKYLRKAAHEEGVKVIGTIGILDRLYYEEYIDEKEYHRCFKALDENNGDKVRLPNNEIKERLNK